MSQRVCRTCFHATKSGRYVELDTKCNLTDTETVAEMLLSVVPEINLQVVVDPVVCKNCLAMLQSSFRFRKMCLVNETRLAEQLQMNEMECIELKYVDESEVKGALTKPRVCKVPAEAEAPDEELHPLSQLISSVDEIKVYYEQRGVSAPIEIIEFGAEEDSGQNEHPTDPLLVEDSEELNQSNEDSPDESESVAKCTVAKTNVIHTTGSKEVFNESHPLKNKVESSKKFSLTCRMCSKTFNTYQDAVLHAKHGHKTCRLCKKIFSSTTIYKAHIRSHTRNNKIKTECKECGVTFSKSSIYYKHMKEEHKMILPARRLKNHLYPCLCDVCGKGFADYTALLSHKAIHNRPKRKFNCRVCDKTFAKKKLLEMHEKVHINEKSYMCEMCGIQFKYASSLLRHKRVHLGISIGKLHCHVCGKRFPNPSALNIHFAAHSGIRHKCELCDRTFTLSSNLKRHMKVHTGEKPFSCDLCGQRFTRHTGLKQHQTSEGCKDEFKRQDLPTESSECKLCGRVFKYKRTLALHLKTHQTGNGNLSTVCEICGKNYSNVKNMKRHLMSHSDEKQFACEWCDKRFAIKPQLVIHVRRHTGEKPYKCQLCDMRFVESGELCKHLKRHKN